MKIKTYTGSLIQIGHNISEEERLLITKNQEKNKYINILTIEGDRSKIDYLVECKKCGWFTITKKAFKRGSGCQKCSNKKRIEKIKQTKRDNHIMSISKVCECCNKAFEVENTSRKRIKKFCSNECMLKCRKERLLKQNQDKTIRMSNSEKMKKEYANGKRVATGGRAKWIKYKDFKVQGGFELLVCKSLDKLKKSKKILDWEYTNDKIPYNKISGGKSTYLLDFKVYISEYFFFYIETKGFSIDNDIFKWSAVLKNGFALKVFYQKTHEKLIEKNPEFILEFEYFSKLENHIYKEKNDFKLLKPNKEFL